MRRSFVALCCFFFACTLFAQTQLTLNAVLEKIEKNNPLILSYENRIKSANELVGTANAWAPPKAGLELDKNPYSFNNFYAGVVRTSFIQDLPNGKVIGAKRNYLRSLSQIDMNESAYQKNKLYSQAKEAYYGIYIAQKNVQILKENISILEAMIVFSEKQMAAGKGDMAGIFKLKARLADKETKLVHDENMIKAYMATINYLTNTDLNQAFTIDTAGIVKDYRNLVFLYNKDSIECKRSDIMQMNSMISSMKLNQNVMSLRSKPVFGLRFEHFWITGMPDMFSVMGTMTIPIAPWSARSYKSEVKAMGFEIAAMQQEKDNMVNMASQMIKMLVIEMNSEYTELSNYTNKVIPAYKKSFDAYMLAYRQNTSDLFMVLMAFDDLQMSQMEYVEHLSVLLKVQTEYEKEMQIR